MADAYEALDSLRAMIRVKREEEKESLARGRRSASEDSKERSIGKCEAFLEVIGLIGAQIKSNNGDLDDETKPAAK